MKMKTLGRTGLQVSEVSFGALPIQRVPEDEAVRILRAAYEGGINFYDSAHRYTDSQEKLGLAFADVRKNIVLATKTYPADYRTTRSHIENGLRLLRTDYIDLYQLHFIKEKQDPADPESSAAALFDAQKAGLVRYVGVTCHSIDLAREALEQGIFDTIQFPFSYLSSEKEAALVKACAEKNIGFIAMKSLAGGLLSNAEAVYAFMAGFPNVVPIYGIQRMEELGQFLDCAKRGVTMTPELSAAIERERAALTGGFCRGCGYCAPCPADIPISWAARMSLFVRRAPPEPLMSEESNEKMARIESCLHCGACKSRCPYELDIPVVLKENLTDYRSFRDGYLAGKQAARRQN